MSMRLPAPRLWPRTPGLPPKGPARTAPSFCTVAAGVQAEGTRTPGAPLLLSCAKCYMLVGWLEDRVLRVSGVHVADHKDPAGGVRFPCAPRCSFSA